MNDKIKALKEKHKKELQALIRQENAKEKIFAALAHIDIKGFSPHVAYADYTITLEPVADLSDAICAAEKLDPLAIFKVKDSCCTFIPETFLGRYLEKNKNAREEVVGAYIYQIEGIYGQPEKKTLECYTEAAGYIIQVDIPVLKDPDTYRSFRKIDFRGGYRIENTTIVNKSGHFRQSIRWWSSPEHPNNFTLY